VLLSVRFIRFIGISIFLVGLSFSAWGQYQVLNIKKLAVFPAMGLGDAVSDQLWWQTRELLTSDLRFTVATRRFMINRQVLAPHGPLKPADVVILSKILEADALVINHIVDKQAHLIVYRGEDGVLLWEDQNNLNSQIPVKEQVLSVFQKLSERFLKQYPFHGYQVSKPQVSSSGSEMSNNNESLIKYGFFGSLPPLVGQSVYWTKINATHPPLLLNINRKSKIATGEVTQIYKQGIVQIKVTEYDNLLDLENTEEVALVLNKESNEVTLNENQASVLGSEYLAREIHKKSNTNQTSPEATFIGFIGTLGLTILLAF